MNWRITKSTSSIRHGNYGSHNNLWASESRFQKPARICGDHLLLKDNNGIRKHSLVFPTNYNKCMYMHILWANNMLLLLYLPYKRHERALISFRNGCTNDDWPKVITSPSKELLLGIKYYFSKSSIFHYRAWHWFSSQIVIAILSIV